jgi:diadenosine tetraphosphate (Ap4A) HIT family hydrolase
VNNCYSCQWESDLAAAPMSERVHVGEFWRAAHAFNTTLPGWLVLIPRRHVTSIAELTLPEATELGPLLHRLSRALHDAVGCQKTYVMQFAEAEGFSHVHFHLVPRMPDLPAEHRGPRIFHYLTRPPDEWLTPETRNELAAGVARRMTP